MPDKKDPEPIFGEKEIGPILSKAFKLQHEQQTPDASATATHGLSLSELQQIATEFGVDPHFVALAADIPDASAEQKPSFYFWGGPFFLDREHIIEGYVDDEKWQDAVSKLRKVFSVQGESDQVGTAWEWKAKRKSVSTLCSVVPRGNRVKVTFNVNTEEWRSSFPVFMGVAGLIILLFSFRAGLDTLFLTAGLFATLTTAIYLLVRTMYGGWMKSQHRRIDQALRELTKIFSEERPSQPPLSVKSAPVPEAPPLLNAKDMQAEEPPAVPRARTRA